MMETAKSIINFFIASGVLAWLIRSIVKLYLDKDIEKYKHELAKQLNLYQILHTERMVVIKEIYKKIDNTFRNVERLIQPNQLVSKDAGEIIKNELENNLNTLSNYFGENKIFFSSDHASAVDTFIKDIRDVSNQWPTRGDIQDSYSSAYITGTGKNWTQLQQSTLILKEKLESVFRLLIGVN